MKNERQLTLNWTERSCRIMIEHLQKTLADLIETRAYKAVLEGVSRETMTELDGRIRYLEESIEVFQNKLLVLEAERARGEIAERAKNEVIEEDRNGRPMENALVWLDASGRDIQ